MTGVQTCALPILGQETAEAREAWKYLARVLWLAPDAIACWAVVGVVLLNRLATTRPRVLRGFDLAVAGVRATSNDTAALVLPELRSAGTTACWARSSSPCS